MSDICPFCGGPTRESQHKEIAGIMFWQTRNADLQSRLTAAETRIKELEKDAEILNWMEKHNWSTEGALDCLYSVSIREWVSDRAELDKLKGTK